MIRSLLTSIVLAASLHASAIDLTFYVQHAICGADTGGIYMSITNGVAPFSISWSDGSTGTMLNGVPPGIYSVTVVDANGDSATEDVEVLELNELFPTFGGEAYSCTGGCDGNFYQYVELPWSTYTITFDPPGPVGNANPNGIYFSELCTGVEYTATITADNGCTGTIGPITVSGPFQPQLLSTTVTPSCPNGSTGSVTLVFDQVSMVYITGPDSINAPSITNPYTVSNLAPGVYTGMAWGDLGNPGGGTSCYLSFAFEIPVTTEPCGTISGTVYADVDGDCLQDQGEPGIPYQVLQVQPGDHYILADAMGNFNTELPFGSYFMNASNPDYDVICPTFPAPFDLNGPSPSAIINVAMDPIADPDLSSFVSMGVHVPGFDPNYYVSVNNAGPYTFNNVVLDLYFDPMMIPVFSSGSPDLVGPGHYQWTIDEVGPYTNIGFNLIFTVPANASLIGTQVTATSTVVPANPDGDPSNDSYSTTRTIVGSFDPNDKQVQTSSQLADGFYFIDVDEWVDYTIRFQNTGTAPAINVVLIDTIPIELDLASLEILGGSHSFTPSIDPGRVLRFEFPGIMLPDSTSDFAGSQGFVSFRLKPVEEIDTLLEEIISNEADIYFDFNEPIRTNAAVLMITITVGQEENEMALIGVFPNPAQEMVEMRLDGGSWMLEVIGIDGRVIQTVSDAADRHVLDISQMAPGHYTIRALNASGAMGHAKFIKQ
jgi:uncharacterized repeat protein (TIGR01451 family)